VTSQSVRTGHLLDQAWQAWSEIARLVQHNVEKNGSRSSANSSATALAKNA